MSLFFLPNPFTSKGIIIHNNIHYKPLNDSIVALYNPKPSIIIDKQPIKIYDVAKPNLTMDSLRYNFPKESNYCLTCYRSF